MFAMLWHRIVVILRVFPKDLAGSHGDARSFASTLRMTCAIVLALTGQSVIAGAPTSRHVYNPKPAAAVDAAIRALGREYADAQSGGKTKLRTTCNYFKQNRSDDVTPEAIL